MRIPPGCRWFDFELEVAAVVGREGCNLAPDVAEDYIAGFMIFNDWSARDVQMYEMKTSLGSAKAKDGANTLGPMLVTADELEPFRSRNSYRLEMKAFSNDRLVGHGWLDQMDWSWGDMLAYASRGSRLQVGDVIGSGTVPTGCLVEQFSSDPKGFRGWLTPGDVVRLEVEQLGSTTQVVLPAHEKHPLRTGF